MGITNATSMAAVQQVMEHHNDADSFAHYDGPSKGLEMLDEVSEFTIAQTRKGCLQEACGCEANSEFVFGIAGARRAMIEEQSSCLVRFCCGNDRWWETKMVAGSTIDGPAMAGFYRPCKCKVGNCKCCCYQEVLAEVVTNSNNPEWHFGDGTGIGGLRETCWYCVPTFELYRADQSPEYRLHQPTCCGGVCVNCCAQGCCNCRIPFYFYPHDNDVEDAVLFSSKATCYEGQTTPSPEAQITKVWTGLGQEFLSDADTFEVKVPDSATRDSKVRLIGATLLINQVFFEKDKNEDN